MVERQTDLRVCHVIHSLREGGAEHLLVTLAQAASQVRLEMTVLSLMPHEGLSYTRQLSDLGVRVVGLELATRWDARGLLHARQAIRDIAPDVVHSHLKHADLVGAFAARTLGIPLVSTLHVIEDAPSPLGRFKRRLAGEARLRIADRTIAVSEAQRRWYTAAFAANHDRVVTLHNAVRPAPSIDPEARLRLRASLGVNQNEIMMVMVAIMRPGKGHEDALAAMERIPDSLGVHLVFAGDGPQRPALEDLAHRSPAAPRLRFPGFVEDVPTLLAAADLVVQPSHFDALPTTLIYALAAGVPAIATGVGGIPEIVTPEVGCLVPPAQPNALAQAIESLAADADVRRQMGTAARQRFEAHFQASVWAEKLRVLYEDVVGRGALRSLRTRR
ncbi:MAG TPA: glycosyltransferase [Egibacteraceae bacterium]|nr:glycosyltransferase [Egibacteraceae bacterium]